MGKVIERFAGNLQLLSHSEKHVLYFIENQLEVAKNQSLTKMAEQNNVSTTTIVRMCHKLGLEGFSELKYVLKTLDNDLIPSDKNIIDRHRQNLEWTFSQLNPDKIKQLTEQMIRSEKIVIVAVGLSKMIGEYFGKMLMQVNKPTIYVYESHIIDLLPNMVGRADLVFFISSSGETKTIVNIAEKLRYHQVSTAAITNTVDCSLNQIVSTSISANVAQVMFAGYDLTPRSTLLELIDILFESYFIRLQTEQKS